MSVTSCLESISFFIVKNCHNKKRGDISISAGNFGSSFLSFTRKRLIPFVVMVVHLSLLCERESNCEETALGSPSKENDGKVDLWYTDRGKKTERRGEEEERDRKR